MNKKEPLANRVDEDPDSSTPEVVSTGDFQSEFAVPEGESRREFMSSCANLAMIGGVVSGYGMLGYCGLRFLSPDAENENLDWQFVATLESLAGVGSFEYTASSGVKIVIARMKAESSDAAPVADTTDPTSGGQEEKETGFLALSSVCPHLGCQVFWESANDRFFCPCHNGTFDASGKATGGPPADAKQSLTQYPTRIRSESLYVLAPLKTITRMRGDA